VKALLLLSVLSLSACLIRSDLAVSSPARGSACIRCTLLGTSYLECGDRFTAWGKFNTSGEWRMLYKTHCKLDNLQLERAIHCGPNSYIVLAQDEMIAPAKRRNLCGGKR